MHLPFCFRATRTIAVKQCAPSSLKLAALAAWFLSMYEFGAIDDSLTGMSCYMSLSLYECAYERADACCRKIERTWERFALSSKQVCGQLGFWRLWCYCSRAYKHKYFSGFFCFLLFHFKICLLYSFDFTCSNRLYVRSKSTGHHLN